MSALGSDARGRRSVLAFLLTAWATVMPTAGQVVTANGSRFGIDPASTIGGTVRTDRVAGVGVQFVAGGDASDVLFQHAWWYRVNGANAREFALSNRTSGAAAGSVLTLTYAEPEGFTATARYTLTDGPDSPPSANVAMDLSIRNTTESQLNLSVFNYVDVDVQGGANDSARLIEPGRIEIGDAPGSTSQFLGLNANAYLVAPRSFQFSPLARLANNFPDNFANVGLPLSLADFTGAMQWNLSIAPGEQITVRSAVSINQPAAPSVSDAICPADFNGQGGVTTQDLFDFLSAWFAVQPTTDFNASGNIDVFDVIDYVRAWGAGCA